MTRRWRFTDVIVWGAVLLFLPVHAGLAEEIDFGRDIRPLLSDKCFQCHGADEEGRSADLRLDDRNAAVAERNGVRAIHPGRPDLSLVLTRINAADPDERMPPPDSNKSLTAEQKELIRKWIEQGAEYEEHWAFQPVRDVPVPEVDSPWCRNEIDAFILQKLNSLGIAPSPEADRATLIRRLYQDLLGLLPTPEETAAFVSDDSPHAYEALVDRLLASPHYGERWGRHWLDQARYADSHGFTIDGPRTMWPYRDWVIQAFNSDMPFDQFTIEQLAGDLLPSPTKSQLVATGFHRNTLINQEGGVKPDQYRHEAIVDRVNTTATVWLGLTMGCAQCHTHKFDPITHTEYYRMYAFFNQCVDANDQGPTTEVLQGELFGLTAQQEAALARLASLKNDIANAEQESKHAKIRKLQNVEWKWSPAAIVDYSTASNGTFQRLPDGSLLSEQNGDANDTYRISLEVPAEPLTAIRLRVLPHPSLPKNGPGLAKNGNFVLTNVVVRHNGNMVPIRAAWADHEQPNFPAQDAIDQDSKSGWAINVSAEQKAKSPRLKMNAEHEIAFLLQTPLQRADGENELVIELYHGSNSNYLIGRFAFDLSSQESPPGDVTDDSDQKVANLKNELQMLESMIPGKGIPERQMIMADKDTPVQTFRLHRGDFLKPATEEGELLPGVPAALVANGANVPPFKNRLDLARWLVSRENPLTARVAVNRIWMRYFGRGLVETENDFGFQGSLPSHPKLLDWLAGEFMRQNWSMKQLHKTIVMSATYRQSSDHRPELTEIDPLNILLARQSRLRVDAEIIRDQALCVSGKLTSAIGGPSVFPPQPDGVYAFTQTKKVWNTSTGPNRYRRTMYTMFYRSAPHPLLTTFDSPDFSTTCTQRPRSNTPLQSLTLANDEMFTELAQATAQRLDHDLGEKAGFPDRLDYLFQLCFSRSPNAAEQAALETYWNAEHERFLADVDAARRLAGVTESTEPAQSGTLAAWTSTARVLMNTDEFVTRN